MFIRILFGPGVLANQPLIHWLPYMCIYQQQDPFFSFQK